MQLIKKLGMKIGNNRKYGCYSIFLCPYCNKEVEKYHSAGIKADSCGCKKRRSNNYIHGFKGTRLYSIWLAMKARCKHKNTNSYNIYGGRGIKVCDEWLNFIPFKDWALANGYKDNLTLDRKDNDKNYEPSNCQWITIGENVRKSKSAKLSWKEVNEIRKLHKTNLYSHSQLAKMFGIGRPAITKIVNNYRWNLNGYRK